MVFCIFIDTLCNSTSFQFNLDPDRPIDPQNGTRFCTIFTLPFYYLSYNFLLTYSLMYQKYAPSRWFKYIRTPSILYVKYPTYDLVLINIRLLIFNLYQQHSVLNISILILTCPIIVEQDALM